MSLTWKTSPQNSGDVFVVFVLVDLNGSNSVQNKHSVVAAGGDIGDHRIRALPEGQVLTIAEVVLDVDEALSRVSIGEDETHTGDLGHTLGQEIDLGKSTVVGDRLIRAVARSNLVLNGGIGTDQVWEVGLATAPTNAESANIAAMVSASIGSKRV